MTTDLKKSPTGRGAPMNNYQRFYSELNSEQRSAVDAINGPILVLAGPGTGKTQLLSVRAGAILAKTNINPENILILTYTTSAAKAMKERLARIIGLAGYDVWVGTFHSFANSIIQESADAANYAGERIPMDEVERSKLIEYILNNTDGIEEIRPFRAPYTYLREILQKISELKKDGVRPKDLENYLRSGKGDYRELEDKHRKRLNAFSIVYKRYEELKTGIDRNIFDERGRYDFDDMILFATEAFRNEKALKSEYQAQYRYVMVDEFQDTNGAQLDLLLTLFDYKDPNLACVGDDDQSIYRFQGASVANFKILASRFPGIKTISLKDNYRSSDDLIGVSSRVISMIPKTERMCMKDLKSAARRDEEEITFRVLTTQEEELIYIVEKIRELKERIENDKSLSEEDRKLPYNNIAVLIRKRDGILKIIDALLRSGIPYATDGKEDISGEHRVKQLMDVLELAQADPGNQEIRDLALYKVISSDYFGIPQTDILRFISYVNESKRRSAAGGITLLVKLLGLLSEKKGAVKFEKPGNFYNAARVIRNLLDGAATKSVHALLMDYIKEAGIYRFILKHYADDDILRIRELRSLGSFVNMIKTSDTAKPGLRLSDFMDEMKTRKDHNIPVQGSLVTLSQAGVRVYTAHGSKGLEFHSVIIPFCLQNVSWPARRIPEKIVLPSDIFKTKERARDKDLLKKLAMQDETRLFYVAITRAKSCLVFTASPSDDSVPSFYLDNAGIVKDNRPYKDEEKLVGRSLDVTDLEDPFIGTDEVLKDMIANLTLNPTRLNNYITCNRKFLYNDILKLPGAKKKSLVFGNCVHKALEEIYKSFKRSGRFPSFEFFKNSFIKELRYQGVDRTTERDILNKSKSIREWFDKTAKDPVVPVGLERKLVVTVGENIIFTGKYDKVEWEDERKGLVRIVDYKTGKPDDHLTDIDKCTNLADSGCDGYLRQLVCYKLLFEKDKKESKGRRVGSGELVFTEPVTKDIRSQGYRKGQFVTKRIPISDDMVAQAEDLIKTTWGKITALKFDKLTERDRKICGNCDFDTICWSGS